MNKILILLTLIRLTYRKTKVTGDGFFMATIRLFDLLLFKNFSPEEILAFAPHLPSQYDRSNVLISKYKSLAKLVRVNDPKQQILTENKDVFYKICRENKLPVPEHILTSDEGDPYLEKIHKMLAKPDGEQKVYEYFPKHFIKKDRSGAYARGFEIYCKKDGHFVSNDGETFNASELIASFTDKTKAPCVVQQQIYCHAALARLTGSPVAQSTRLVTIRVGEDKARPSFYTMKLVGGGNVTDNFSGGHIGNMLAHGDIKTGILEAAVVGADEGMGLKTISRHPDTGLKFSGFQLPYWQETLELACKAHETFYQFGIIGWDIAITDEGPVLFEGNIWQDPPTYAPHVMSRSDWELIFG